MCTRHIVHALGGTAAIEKIPLQPIPHPKLEDAGGGLALDQSISDHPRQKAAVLGDSVSCFDEISAADGALGRLPGCQVLTLVKGLMCKSIA